MGNTAHPPKQCLGQFNSLIYLAGSSGVAVLAGVVRLQVVSINNACFMLVVLVWTWSWLQLKIVLFWHIISNQSPIHGVCCLSVASLARLYNWITYTQSLTGPFIYSPVSESVIASPRFGACWSRLASRLTEIRKNPLTLTVHRIIKCCGIAVFYVWKGR